MISTFHFALYVGISCVGYELSRSSALRQMQRALAEKEATNAQLLQVSKAKERFIANTSHGAPASFGAKTRPTRSYNLSRVSRAWQSCARRFTASLQ
jgi:hypothetical protein